MTQKKSKVESSSKNSSTLTVHSLNTNSLLILKQKILNKVLPTIILHLNIMNIVSTNFDIQYMIDLFLTFAHSRNFFIWHIQFFHRFFLYNENMSGTFVAKSNQALDWMRRWKLDTRSKCPHWWAAPWFLGMIFGKKGAAYLWVFTVCFLCTCLCCQWK